MVDETMISDTAILLNPPMGNSGDIRPGRGWATTTDQDREIMIQVGKDLNREGYVGLIKHYNVKEFTVVLLNPSTGIKFPVSTFHFMFFFYYLQHTDLTFNF